MIKLFINNVKTRLSQYGPFRRLDAFCSSGMYPVEVLGTEPGFLPLLTAIFSENRYNQVLAVLPTQKEAEDFASDIQLFLGDCAHHFPSWQTVPYSDLSAASWIHAKRSRVLSLLLGGKRIFTVAPLAAFLSPLPEVEKTRIRLFPINSGKKLDLESLVKMLSEYGYDRVPRVTLPGEFAVRGEVLDLFLPGESRPIRLLLDFETVENIRYFDPITQRSQDFLDSTSVPPLSECIMLPGEEEKTMHAMREKKIPEKAAAEAFERMKQDPYSSGLEYTIPLTYTHPASILDYMSQDSAVFFIDYERLHQGAEMMEREYKTCFARIRGSNKPVAPPETALLQFTQLESRVSRKILFPMHKSEKSGQNRVVFACDPPHSYFGNIVYFTEEMGNLTGLGYSIYIFADYEAQAERIRHLVQDLAVSVIPAGITRGFTIPELKLMLIHENEIFRRKKHVARTLRKIESEKIDSFVDLEEGDFIVHFQHGIGCYRGLHRIKAAGNERDYITLEYADKEIIYLPTEQVNLVERYITPGIRSPRLDKIGGRSWAARKAKVKKAVEDIAAQLLDLYS
ncbi:MAG: transcription-repair coupling factor, partial [Spirochaetaceae bacterium]